MPTNPDTIEKMPNKSPKEECKHEGINNYPKLCGDCPKELCYYCVDDHTCSTPEPMPHLTPDKIIEQKLKELGESFGWEEQFGKNSVAQRKMESFLEQALTESYLAGREEGSVNEAEFHETACQNLLLEIIEKMPKEMRNDYRHTPFEAGEIKGFNACRSKTLSLISEMKK